MKRPAIACLWGASIAATWLIVRGATTEGVASSPKPGVARESTIHVARPSLSPPSAKPVALEVVDDNSAFREALARLERDISDGRWSVEDRDRLNHHTRTLTAPQAGELYDVLFPKLNEGTVKSDIEGPPI